MYYFFYYLISFFKPAACLCCKVKKKERVWKHLVLFFLIDYVVTTQIKKQK